MNLCAICGKEVPIGETPIKIYWHAREADDSGDVWEVHERCCKDKPAQVLQEIFEADEVVIKRNEFFRLNTL